MASFWNQIASLWQPSSFVCFVVGSHETEIEAGKKSPTQQTFQVKKNVLMELSPVVKAAVTGECKESETQEIRLPQFQPADFELFIRLAQSVACSCPSEITAPRINDSLILSVVPIAAYLGVEALLKKMEDHVHNTPRLETVLVTM